MNRRQFIRGAAASAAAIALSNTIRAEKALLPEPTIAKLPRWRGFNLLEWFDANNRKPFKEEDFALIAELGFDFVRLPLSYRRSEEHTSELQSLTNLVCRLLLEKKKKKNHTPRLRT